MSCFDPVRLAVLMEEELIKCGACPESAWHVSTSMVQTSLRGVDSHGINLFPHYCRAVTNGRVNGQPQMSFEQTAASVILLNADHAFGHHAGAVAMQRAVETAKTTGMAAVSVYNSTHFGAAAYFGLMAAKAGCLGFAFTNADALVKAHEAKEAFCGTNPICFTAPLANEDPFCLDMATSQVSWNKINNYRRVNKFIPEEWAFNEHGESVVDPHAACSLSPTGGYKGFGLGMMVEILCSVISSSPTGREIKPMYKLPLDDSKRRISHFFMAMDIAKFSDPATFPNRLQAMVDSVRAMEGLTPESEMMVAGDPEKKSVSERNTKGIPVDEVKISEFMAISQRFAEGFM